MIEAEDLRKAFAGAPAVDAVTFRVAAGEVYGLIGPNGAGKTTTLRIAAGLLRPDAGRARIAGADTQEDPEGARARVGYLTGTTGLYERLTVAELIVFFARLHGLSEPRARERVQALAAALAIGGLLARRCAHLSTGERQRVSFARALAHDPPALILDEPTAGLDVIAGRFARDLVRRARDQGRAVLLSTHDLFEAEALCDRVGLIHRGRLRGEGTPAELRARAGAATLEQAFLVLCGEEPAVPASPAPGDA